MKILLGLRPFLFQKDHENFIDSLSQRRIRPSGQLSYDHYRQLLLFYDESIDYILDFQIIKSRKPYLLVFHWHKLTLSC